MKESSEQSRLNISQGAGPTFSETGESLSLRCVHLQLIDEKPTGWTMVGSGAPVHLPLAGHHMSLCLQKSQ